MQQTIKMKKAFSIITIASMFAACGGGQEAEQHTRDSAAQMSVDSALNAKDTSAVNSSLRGDSTTSSGSHGEGSGSRVGGGVSGGAQGQSSDSSKK